MIVKKIQLGNAWGISQQIELADLPPMNVLIGKNNSGKSNVLKALRWVKAHTNSLQPFELESEVAYEAGVENQPNPQPSILVELSLTDADKSFILERCNFGTHNLDYVKAARDAVYMASSLCISLHYNPHSVPRYKAPLECCYGTAFSLANYRSIENRTNPKDFETNARQIFHDVVYAHVAELVASKLQYIGGWRSLKGKENTPTEIVQNLKMWRDPPNKPDARHLIKKWERFELLFRELTRIEDIQVRFEQGNDKGLSLLSEGRLLSVDDCGDGLQHLIMLAYYLIADREAILLIEEPETHLHPELQRNLMHIIKRESKGQAFVTTHSPVLLDALEGCCIYRVEREPHQTVQRCLNPADYRYILDLLDVRPSDILQANGVIWVEGPTDRMFIKRCFELLDFKLIEGVHYQFAYYGGRVRSHYTFDQLDQQQGIDVLRLCRHAIMVCDSDKKNEEAPIDSTKERLKKECTEAGGYYWVTAGREIENYINDEALTRTVQRLTGKNDMKVSLDKFDKLPDVLEHLIANTENTHGLKDYGANKAKLMQEFLKDVVIEDLNRYDLRDRLNTIIELVRGWSGEPKSLNE